VVLAVSFSLMARHEGVLPWGLMTQEHLEVKKHQDPQGQFR
jgi:hypothetical protein